MLTGDYSQCLKHCSDSVANSQRAQKAAMIPWAHRGGLRKQHAIKVIDIGLQISTCSHARMDQRNLISVHSISSSTKTISDLLVRCLNALSVQQNCEKITVI